ncbi:MAG: ATP-binding protein [Verrucomicrobiales bacterium]
MLNEEQVQEVLTSTEADRIERTRSITDTDKFREAICSFSNDMPAHGKPGYLLIGVEDDGSLSPNVAITDDLQKQFASYRDDGQILPQPMLSVFKQPHPGGGEFLVVQVQPSDLPPVRYKGRVNIRVGPRKATANETEERRLIERRSANFRTFDIAPCLDASLDELDLDAFQNTYRREAVDPEILKENHRELTLQLAALRFFNLNRGCPTNAGALVFGADPLAYFPGAYVQYVRYDGETLGDEVEAQKQFTGNLMSLLRELDNFVKGRFTQKPIKTSTLREELIWDYPENAVRELLINAVLHRDYQSNQPVRFYQFSDRIEIQNPGGLYGDARPENFPNVNDYRNPVIAEVMAVLGYANRFGRGVARAQKLLKDNGSPEASFTLEQTHFLAQIPKHSDR